MKTLNWVLLFLIVVGLGLIFTQKYWVSGLVNYILSKDTAGINTDTGSKWTGKVTSVRTDCAFDGICSITVSNKEVITNNGGRIIPPEKMGEIRGEMARNPMEDFVGKNASVYARKLDAKHYTLEGSNDFYIEILK